VTPDLADAYRQALNQQMQQWTVGHLPRAVLVLWGDSGNA